MKTFLTEDCPISNQHMFLLQRTWMDSSGAATFLTDQMWVFQVLNHLDFIELNIEVLIDRLEDTADLDIVLEFDSDFVVHQGLEEAM